MNLVILSFLILMTVMQILKYFFKVDRSMIMCGIFAFSGRNDLTEDETKTVINKMKILGIYNESRGTHGCGIFINNEIKKGIDKVKLFSDFIEDEIFKNDSGNNILIAHTRQASRGSHTLENTHPFLIDDELVGVHNGTIENIWELSKKYDIDYPLGRVDSFGLYQIIHHKGLNVLNEYKGNAALIWTNLSEPNSMYVYHGASFKSRIGDAKEEEERPMFYMKTNEGIYFSSISKALYAIRDEEEQFPETLIHNRVIKIKDGKFTNYRRVIDRGESNLPIVYNYSKSPISKDPPSNNTTAFLNPLKVEPLIWREKPQFRDEKFLPYVFFWRGRFYRKSETEQVLCNGLIAIHKKGNIIPVDYAPSENKYYFYQGVMMESANQYDFLLESISNNQFNPNHSGTNFALHISKFSKYPVTNLMGDAGDVEKEYRYKWYHKGVTCLEGFTAKFGGRGLVIKNGYLIAIKGSNRGDKEVFYESFIKAGKANKELNIKQTAIPFSNTQVKLDNFDPVLDTVYTSLEDVLLEMTDSHYNACTHFIKKALEESSNIDVTKDEITKTWNFYLLQCLEEGQTIRTMLTGNTPNDIKLLDDLLMDEKAREIAEKQPPFIETKSIEFPKEEISFPLNENFHNHDDDLDDESAIIEAERQEAILEDDMQTVESSLDPLKELKDYGEILEASEGELGRLVGDKILKGVDNIKHGVAEVTEKFSTPLTTKVNNLV